jgi:hypothetical protein
VGHYRRICQEEADGKEDVRRELVRNGRPLRSSAEPLGDDELLAKLRDLGLDVDRAGVERLCAGALSAEEVAGPIVAKLKLDDDMTVDWVWISLLALWQRWWPDRPGLELLDDKMTEYTILPAPPTRSARPHRRRPRRR